MADLQTTLAAIRRTESGSFDGNYSAKGKQTSAGTPRGAYGILDSNWAAWSVQAGIGGASFQNKAAQDRVAATVLQVYYDRYKNWDTAVAAWYGGTRSADLIARRGGVITNATIANYVKQVKGFQTDPGASENPATPITAAVRLQSNTEAGWVFPVAGPTEWSGGSYMDKHTKGDRSHYAIDVYAKAGTPIISPVSGQVIGQGSGELGGNWVQVKGNDGKVYYFAHMKDTAKVAKGDRVMAGGHLGFVGNTGSARGTSSHLHFSVKVNGKPVNPKDLLNGAVTSNGLYADSQFIPPEEDQPGAGVVEADPVSASFGQTIPEAMIQTASNAVAGGTRVDPRLWTPDDEGTAESLIDRDPVELNTETEVDEEEDAAPEVVV